MNNEKNLSNLIMEIIFIEFDFQLMSAFQSKKNSN